MAKAKVFMSYTLPQSLIGLEGDNPIRVDIGRVKKGSVYAPKVIKVVDNTNNDAVTLTDDQSAMLDAFLSRKKTLQLAVNPDKA